MHGDAHPGNVYFRDGEAGLAGLAGGAARPSEPRTGIHAGHQHDDRRPPGQQRELLDALPGALAAAGGPDLDRDELWDRYRQGALYAYVAALITAGMGGMQAERIALEGLRRGVAALEDLDTVALLEKSL